MTRRAGQALLEPPEAPQEPGASTVRRWLSPVLVVSGVALVILGFFLSIYRAKGFNVPIGWDTSKYLWRTTLSRAYGLANLQGHVPQPIQADVARPAFPVLASALSSLGGVSPFRVAAVLPSVAAAATGLAAGAFVGAALGRSWWEQALVALGVGTSTLMVRLAGPETYQDNLFAAAVFMAAAIPIALSMRDRRALLPAILLFGTGGVIHWAFFVFMVGVLGLAALAYLPSSFRSWRLHQTGPLDTPSARLGEIAAGAGALAGATIFGVLATNTRSPRLSQSEFARKLRHDIGRYKFPILLPVAALGGASIVPARKGKTADAERAWFVLTFLLSWCAVTLAGYLGFKVLHLHIPAHRFLAFALALPLLGTLGVLWMGRLAARATKPIVGILLVAVLGAAAAYVSHVQWFNVRTLMDPAKIQDATTANAYLGAAGIDPSRPIVFIVKDDNNDWSYTALMGHMIRAALPADRIGETYLFVGSPDDYLAGRPTGEPGSGGDISTRYFESVQSTYARDPVALILASTNDAYFGPWVQAHPLNVVGPNVALVRGPFLPQAPHERGGPLVATTVAAPPSPVGRIASVKLALMAVGSLVVLFLVGSGWTAALLGRWLRRQEGLAVAPAVGIATLVMGGILLDRLGVRIRGAGGVAVPLLVAAAGWGVAAIAHRRRA
jgi:hypothetical protein